MKSLRTARQALHTISSPPSFVGMNEYPDFGSHTQAVRSKLPVIIRIPSKQQSKSDSDGLLEHRDTPFFSQAPNSTISILAPRRNDIAVHSEAAYTAPVALQHAFTFAFLGIPDPQCRVSRTRNYFTRRDGFHTTGSWTVTMQGYSLLPVGCQNKLTYFSHPQVLAEPGTAGKTAHCESQMICM